jgi:hypothetical protein
MMQRSKCVSVVAKVAQVFALFDGFLLDRKGDDNLEYLILQLFLLCIGSLSSLFT